MITVIQQKEYDGSTYKWCNQSLQNELFCENSNSPKFLPLSVCCARTICSACCARTIRRSCCTRTIQSICCACAYHCEQCASFAGHSTFSVLKKKHNSISNHHTQEQYGLESLRAWWHQHGGYLDQDSCGTTSTEPCKNDLSLRHWSYPKWMSHLLHPPSFLHF
jgi:hypothetical protein